MWPTRCKPNSVKQIVRWLKVNPYSTESEIQQKVFGYVRKNSYESNKKYADMLRRGMSKGLVSRIKLKIPRIRERYFYFVPGFEKMN